MPKDDCRMFGKLYEGGRNRQREGAHFRSKLLGLFNEGKTVRTAYDVPDNASQLRGRLTAARRQAVPSNGELEDGSYHEEMTIDDALNEIPRRGFG